MAGYIDAWKEGASTIALMASLAFGPTPPPPPLASPAELQTLKQKVQQGDSPSVLPYLRARLLADHPELRTPDGHPRFIMGFLGAADFTPEKTAAAIKASLKYNDFIERAKLPISSANMLHSQSQQTLDHKVSANSFVLGVEITTNIGNQNFSHISLNPITCPQCTAPKHDQSNCGILNPAKIRENHLITTGNALHETAHMLSTALGLRKNRLQKLPGASPGLEQLAEENFADTYSALRMIQIFGQEGLAYQEVLLNGRVRSAKEGDVSHWSVASLHNVLDYAKKHPELQQTPSARLPELAEKLMSAPTQAQLDALKKASADPTNSQHESLRAAFQKMTKGKTNKQFEDSLSQPSIDQHSKLYQLYSLSLDTDLTRYMGELSRHNPQRPASFSPADALATSGPFTPQQIVDLEKLNKALRAPSCPSVAETLTPPKGARPYIP